MPARLGSVLIENVLPGDERETGPVKNIAQADRFLPGIDGEKAVAAPEAVGAPARGAVVPAVAAIGPVGA